MVDDEMCVGIDDDDEDDEYGYGTLCVILWRGCNCSGWIWNCEKSSLNCFFLHIYLFELIALAALIFLLEMNALHIGLRTMDWSWSSHSERHLQFGSRSKFTQFLNGLKWFILRGKNVSLKHWLVECVLVVPEYGVTYLISFY